MASKQKSYLLFLTDSNKKQSKLLLQHRTRPQLLAIRECILNIITGRIKISEGQLTWLKKNRAFLRKVAYKGVTTNELIKKNKIITTALNLARESISNL